MSEEIPCEVWKPIPSAEGYEASDLGRIRRVKPYLSTTVGKVRALRNNGTGYLCVGLSINGKVSVRYVQRLVCEAFHGPAPTPKHQAAHLNGVRSDNRPSNLAWATATENEAHKHQHGTYVAGDAHPLTRLSDLRIQLLRAHVAFGEPVKQAARIFGVSTTQAYRIVRGQARASAGGYLPEIEGRP